MSPGFRLLNAESWALKASFRDAKARPERTSLRPLFSQKRLRLESKFSGVATAPHYSHTLAAAAANVKNRKIREPLTVDRDERKPVLNLSRFTVNGLRVQLLNFDGRASVGELGADGLGLVLRDALL